MVEFLHEVRLASTQSSAVSLQDTIVEIVSLEMADGRLTDPENSTTVSLPVVSSGIREDDVAVLNQGSKYNENKISKFLQQPLFFL